MKKQALPILLFLFSISLMAQPIPPAKWKTSFSKNQVMQGDTVEIRFHAIIPKGVHMYSNDFSCEAGPIPAEIIFKPNKAYQQVGKPVAIGAYKLMDPVFNCEVSQFDSIGYFTQKVILKSMTSFTGSITYQLCDDKSCLSYEFVFAFRSPKVMKRKQ